MSISTTTLARKLAALRKTHAGGRKSKPTPCPRCGAKCAGARLARAHCKGVQR